jgi:hypothetical protein
MEPRFSRPSEDRSGQIAGVTRTMIVGFDWRSLAHAPAIPLLVPIDEGIRACKSRDG